MSGRTIPPVAAIRLMILISGLLSSHLLPAAAPPADSLHLQLHSPQPLTADLAADLSPALSPNQKYLVYASRASGNYDLWIRPMDSGVAVPLTDHPADDHSPQWSSKGKTIAFVSHRDDIDGDILALYLDENRLRASKIVPLVDDPGPQSFPSYSHDGRYLVYQDGAAQQARLVLLDLRRRENTVLTEPGFLQPRFSPVDNRILCLQAAAEESPGAICILQLNDLKNPTPEIKVVYDGLFPAASPAWSPDGKSFVAALTNQDLDGDGLLTYLDRAQIYRFDPAGEAFQYRLLVPGDSRETYPFWGTDDFIYFSSDGRGNLDLYRLPAEGAIPPAVSALAGFEFALSVGQEAALMGKPLRREEGLAKLLALERVRQDFPQDHAIAAATLLESARLSIKMKAQDEAMTFFRRLVRGYPDQREIIAQGLIDYYLLAHRAIIQAEGEITAENPTSLIANLEDVQRQYPDQPMALARSRWLDGWIWFSLKDSAKALEQFDSILSDFPNLKNWPAQALSSKGGLLEKSGDWQGALQAYHYILQRYPYGTSAVEPAVQKILRFETPRGDPRTVLSRLGADQDNPALAAGATQHLAELLAQSGDTSGAMAEYDQLRGMAEQNPSPFVRKVFAEGWIAAAMLEAQRTSMEAALGRLSVVAEFCADIQDGYYSRRAQQLRLALLTKGAESAAGRGRHDEAMPLFQRAIELDPGNVRLHRGYIASAFSAGEIHQAAQEYHGLNSLRKNDPAYLYSLGLCLSYMGGNNRRFLAQSNSLIEAAISQQPDLAFGYLSLGYNYGLMEKLTGRRGRSHNWLERAIAILQLGLSVNDETADPQLESQLWLNLGNSYYELGEYGYARALEAYRQRENYDTIFTSSVQAALTFEKMGRAAAMTGDSAQAERRYQQALEHWRRAGKSGAQLRLLLRLAELHQVSGNYQASNDYYAQAAELAQAQGLEADSAKWLTNCAYNSLQMDQAAEASDYATRALALLAQKEAAPEDSIYNPLALEIFGMTIPIWNFGFLGAGSIASARGFSGAENEHLARTMLQEVYERQGDFMAARGEAYRRMAGAIEQKNREMEARLWSEIGFFDWRLGYPILARRSLLRSLLICQEEGLKAGRLSALINLSEVELEIPMLEYSLPEILQEEISCLAPAGVGFSQEQWQEINATIAAMNPNSSASAVSRQIRGAPSIGFDPERPPSEPANWNLADYLLLLRDEPLPTAAHLRNAIRSEIEILRQGRIGFDLERLRLLSLYAALCMREALAQFDTTLTQTSERLQLEGEALWALQSAIREASRRGQLEQEIQLHLALADLQLRLQDQVGSVAELVAAKDLADASNLSSLNWRICWRLGRASILAERGWSAGPTEAFDLVNSRLPEEWLELAQEAWQASLSADGLLTGGWRNPTEVRLMFELSAERAIAQRGAEELFGAAQKVAAWSFLQNLKPKREDDHSWRSGLALPSDSLGKGLRNGDLLLQILDVEGQTELILLRPNGLSHFTIENADSALARLDSLRRIFDFGSPPWRGAAQAILADLFQPIQEQIRQADRLFIVAPSRWERAPLEWFFSARDSSAGDMLVFRLPEPQSLLLSSTGSGDSVGPPVGFGLEAPLPLVTQARLGSEEESRAAIEKAGVVLIRVQPGATINPLTLPLFLDWEKIWLAEDLIDLKRSGGALLLQGNIQGAAQIAKAAFLGGFDCVLFLPAELPDAALQTLIVSIQRLAFEYPWPQACWQALQNLRHDAVYIDAQCYAKMTPKTNPRTGQLPSRWQDDEAILKYSWKDYGERDRLALALDISTSKAQSTLALNISPRVLKALIHKWQTGFAQHTEFNRAGRSLYEKLILPVLPHLEGISQLIIIPNDDLRPVAFAALKSPRGDDLLDQFAISYAFSISDILTSRRLAFSRPPSDSGLVIMLDSSRPSRELPRLLFAEKEVRSIASTFPAGDLLLAEDTTPAVLAQRAESAAALHFAGHSGTAPDYQRQVHHPGSHDARHGLWNPPEIQNMRLRECGLVVLSCCGDVLVLSPHGDRGASLTELFLSAGVPRVISAMGEIDDFTCAVLFKHFYRHLKAGLGPAQALRMAQLHVRDGLRPNPADWAAFRLWGEPH